MEGGASHGAFPFFKGASIGVWPSHLTPLVRPVPLLQDAPANGNLAQRCRAEIAPPSRCARVRNYEAHKDFMMPLSQKEPHGGGEYLSLSPFNYQ